MDQQDPSATIAQTNTALLSTLPFGDIADFDANKRGFVGTLDSPQVRNAAGEVVWDAASFDFVDGDAPTSVNPSLWRQSTLMRTHGLFELADRVYQVRGLDLSNMTLIETDNGVIVVDTLLSKETGAAALALYRKFRGERPVKAVIFTHSHADHYGGVLGVVTEEEVASGAVEVIAPEGFLEHAVSENVYAGVAMNRRAGYMYGAALDRGPQGQLGAGLGMTLSTGEVTLIEPTLTITTTGQTHTVDGVDIEFQMAPGTEAPAEMHFYFPQLRVLCMAENATHNLHNLLTLRGAVVRDPHMWSQYLTEAIELYADRTDVLFASHHWPTWGTENIRTFLESQRDLYGYIHDQTLRLLNKGLTGPEIAEAIEFPPALEGWSSRGYYGSVSHNVKAIYQRYLGWFDGNPARLWPHPPVEAAKRYVRGFGGIDQVIAQAQAAFDEGDYRWAATLLDHAVFAEPDNTAAKALLADTFEQLGYGAENGTWRNFFLAAATELREGNFGTPTETNAPGVLARLTPEQLFDAVAITINGPEAWDLHLTIDITLTDLGQSFRLTLRNGLLTYVRREPAGDAQLHLTLTKQRLLALFSGDTTSAGVGIVGDIGVVQQLQAVLDPGDKSFNIVTP
ncbi:alkyl/aryl-sulfatase [Microbacterium trichothecenolyticum]|uniref:Linear primary-alkylsulfatase n=1 Tax=Microbacterium trichothecenolyticum TaxID=69370 RepID=A0A0M2HKV7_MICTR|nr:alkyl sulfatase dimerization domain-containing protein [Microbacterium trichothecenolyticum]KJL45007.1 Metallo-beta-lactamase superfamily protein [Microbacterium trichothecenolyticum]